MMYLLLVLLGHIACSLGGSITLIAPNVVHFGEVERVLVMAEEDVQVELHLEAFPDRATHFSSVTKRVAGGGAEIFEVRLEYDDIPDGDALSENKYVYVVAQEVGSQSKQEVRCLISNTIANIFLQTDKPIYTPNQPVQISVYSTDMRNKPTKMPVRVDILTPSGIIVDRRDVNTEFHDELTDDVIPGVYRLTFHIGLKPVVGKWSVKAYVGLQKNNVMKYEQSTEAPFEVEEYVLPSFDCSISGLPQYILASDRTVTLTVTARYNHGRPVNGAASVKVGLAKDDKVSYIVNKFSRLAGGRYELTVQLSEMYDQEPYFNFNSKASGRRLFVQVHCSEESSGEEMEAVDMNTMFVQSPYTVDYTNTPAKFKPGLPLHYKFVLKHANGQLAANTRVKIMATQDVSSGSSHLNGAHGTVIKTDDAGIAHQRLYPSTGARSIKIQITEPEIASDDQRYLYPVSESHGIAVIIPHMKHKVNESVEIDIRKKGGPFSSYLTVVIAGGRILRVNKMAARNTAHEIQHITVTADMIPQARILVVAVVGSQVVADADWIDVVNECASELSVTPVKEEYKLQEEKGHLLVKGSPDAHVLVQMIDKAVLSLSADRTLTQANLFSRLEKTDIGCPTIYAATVNEAFMRAGLLVSSHYRQVAGNSLLNAGLRLDETGCDYTDFRLDSDCCREGRNAPISRNCRSLENDFITSKHPSEQCKLMYRECCNNNTARIPRPIVPYRRRNGGWFGGGGVAVRKLNRDFMVMHSMAGLPGMAGTRGIQKPPPPPDFSRRDMFVINDNIAEAGTRRDFPESVIFPPIKVSSIGVTRHPFNLPDSITTWSVEAVELADDTGMCVAPHTSFSVIKKHFLKLKLPYQAVRGEQLLLGATFHNDADSPLDVTIMMRGVTGVCSKARPDDFTTHTKFVDSGSTVTVHWPVVPMEHGGFEVEVVAMREDFTVLDAVQRILQVVPEGVSSSHTESFVMSPSSRESRPEQCNYLPNGVLRCHLALTLPDVYVANSASAVISVTPNTFGPAANIVMDGLEGKLRMPSGCGEQVMIGTAPGVYAYSYMQETGTPSAAIKEKFESVVKEGVNRILAYIKSNGGIGVWTTTPASTWLTSFVLKVFAQASLFAVNGVDQTLLDRNVHFLYSMQHKSGALNGRFKEHSQVSRHHGEMIGAVKDTDLTLTAFVLIALIESSRTVQAVQYDSRYEQSIRYLGANIAHSSTAYEAALVAYALSSSSHRSSAFNKLKTFASTSSSQELTLRYFPGPEGTAKKILVETAAYAILTALNNGDVDYCHPIVLWLHQQRRNHGIFQSTQDTVIALQALAQYSAATRDRSTELRVQIALSTDGVEPDRQEKMVVDLTDDDKDREIIFQITEEQVEHYPAAVVDISGEGTAQLTIQTLYNKQREDTCAFDLTISAEFSKVEGEANAINDFGGLPFGEEKATLMSITVCARHLLEQPTEMAILDIGLLTGYQAQIKELQEQIDSGVIDFFELRAKSVIIYLRNIFHSEKTCVKFSALQEDPVANQSPAPVKVYDYYNRESECTDFYSDATNPSTWTIDFDQDTCFEGVCPSCYGDDHETPWKIQQLKKVACSPLVTYIIKGKVVGEGAPDENWKVYDVQVETIIKEGSQEFIESSMVQVVVYKNCECPLLSEGSSYLIMGKEEKMVNIGETQQRIRLTLDNDSYVEEWQTSSRTHRQLRSYFVSRSGCTS